MHFNAKRNNNNRDPSYQLVDRLVREGKLTLPQYDADRYGPLPTINHKLAWELAKKYAYTLGLKWDQMTPQAQFTFFEKALVDDIPSQLGAAAGTYLSGGNPLVGEVAGQATSALADYLGSWFNGTSKDASTPQPV